MKCFALLEPLKHLSNKLNGNFVYPVDKWQFRTCIILVQFTSTLMFDNCIQHHTESDTDTSLNNGWDNAAPSLIISRHLNAALCSSSTSIAYTIVSHQIMIGERTRRTFSNSAFRRIFWVLSSCVLTRSFLGSRDKTFLKSEIACLNFKVCRWHVARLRVQSTWVLENLWLSRNRKKTHR